MKITNKELEKIILLSERKTDNNKVEILFDDGYFYLSLEYNILSDKLEGGPIHIKGDPVKLTPEQDEILEGFLNELVAEAEDKAKAKELKVIDYYEYNGKN